MRIGILGGTFDPIHQGHLALARAAQKQFHLEKVIFIPAFIPPHKKDRADITPAPHRYRMVEIAVSDEPDFEVSDIEFTRPEISYTVDTLRNFKKKYLNDSFFLIMGADSYEGMSSWKEPSEIMGMAEILVLRRQGSSISKNDNINWIEMPEYPLSSTKIRETLRKGKLDHGSFFPLKVKQYIHKMKLYGTS